MHVAICGDVVAAVNSNDTRPTSDNDDKSEQLATRTCEFFAVYTVHQLTLVHCLTEKIYLQFYRGLLTSHGSEN